MQTDRGLTVAALQQQGGLHGHTGAHQKFSDAAVTLCSHESSVLFFLVGGSGCLIIMCFF